VPPFHDLNDAALDQFVGGKLVDPATLEFDRPFVTSPRSARNRLEMAFKVVVFPAPLAPAGRRSCPWDVEGHPFNTRITS